MVMRAQHLATAEEDDINTYIHSIREMSFTYALLT